MSRALEHPSECDHCGQFMDRGSLADVWYSSFDKQWKAGHPDKNCPDKPRRKVQEQNVRRDRDEHDAAIEHRFRTLTCRSCGHRLSFHRLSFHRLEVIPTSCPVTVYGSSGDRCGGGWLDDEGDEFPVGPYAPWDELTQKERDRWERAWLDIQPDGSFYPQPSEERLAAGAPDYRLPAEQPNTGPGELRQLNPQKGLPDE